MNKNDSAAGPPSPVPPETVAIPGTANSRPPAENQEGHDPTLKWCIPDLHGHRALALPLASQPLVSEPGSDQPSAGTPVASSSPETPAESAIKGALPEAIQESARDTSSPRGESFEIIVADGPPEDGEDEPPGATDEMASVTPPPLPEMRTVVPPPPREAEAVTPPPIREVEVVTPPPRPEARTVTVLPKREAEVVTPPPKREVEVVTPPPRPEARTVTVLPKREAEVVTPPPRRESVAPTPLAEQAPATSPRLVAETGVMTGQGGDASRPASQATLTTGALPEAPIRMAETAEVVEGEFEVMEPADTPSTPAASTAPTPPPVPGIAGALAVPSQPRGRESPSEAGGSVGRETAPAIVREAPLLPEALSRRPLKKRLKPWFEEVFDEDYLRTLPFMTAQQTLRETAFMKEALSPPVAGEVLDIACGYGRHAIEFGQRGFRVTGLDLSLPLLIRAADEAQRRALSVNFVHADMREMTYYGQFDAAYCVLTSFGYFDEETNLHVASSICRALKPGGRFLVDTINRDYIVSDLPSRVWWEGDGCVVLEEVDFDFHTSRVLIRRSIVFGDGRQVENEISIRAYSLHEMGRVLRRAGFQVLEVSGSLANKEPFLGAASRHVVLVCERQLT
ncbi:MAG: methyltransferase domain-containing protein [Polyangia bacterium]